MIRKGLLLLAALVLLALPLTAGGQSEAPAAETDSAALAGTTEDPALHQPGTLTVATGDPVFPPWMLNDDPAGGEGFENGIIYALAEELGFDRSDVRWVRVGFDEGITPGDKPYDFNIQQYSITEPRREFVDFSIPYYLPDKAVIALPGSPVDDATSFADLREARWGATIGTTDLDYLEEVIGVEGVAVYNSQADTFQALLAGQIDATVAALPTALFVVAVQVPDAAIVATLPPDEGDFGLGLVFEKDSPLVDWINTGLQAILDDGTIDRLVQEYLIGDVSIQAITE